MNKIELKKWDDFFIIAPDFCPYKFFGKKGEGENYEEKYIVNPSLCPLCNLCNFTPLIAITKLDLKPLKFAEYLTLINDETSALISNQSSFLRKKDRLPLIILINPEVFDMMLKFVYKDSKDMYKQVYSYYLNNETPICHILGSPVYFSRKLTKSKVMVVGEVVWK